MSLLGPSLSSGSHIDVRRFIVCWRETVGVGNESSDSYMSYPTNDYSPQVPLGNTGHGFHQPNNLGSNVSMEDSRGRRLSGPSTDNERAQKRFARSQPSVTRHNESHQLGVTQRPLAPQPDYASQPQRFMFSTIRGSSMTPGLESQPSTSSRSSGPCSSGPQCTMESGFPDESRPQAMSDQNMALSSATRLIQPIDLNNLPYNNFTRTPPNPSFMPEQLNVSSSQAQPSPDYAPFTKSHLNVLTTPGSDNVKLMQIQAERERVQLQAERERAFYEHNERVTKIFQSLMQNKPLPLSYHTTTEPAASDLEQFAVTHMAGGSSDIPSSATSLSASAPPPSAPGFTPNLSAPPGSI